LTFLDFFAGIGGFRLGMEMAGHKCLGFCEYDKFAVASYRAMHKTEGEWYGEDVRTIRASELPKADCWCFGFPCQDISVAGKQLGFDGKRSSLFFAVTRLIRDTREEDKPNTLLIENVKNLLSVNGGIDFLKLLIELDEIGYDAEWQVLNSKHFGVPQNRERVFIVGHFRGRSGREVFPVNGADQSASIPIKIIAHRKGYRRNTQTFSPDGITETLDTGQGGGRGHHVMVVGNVNPSGKGMNGNVFDSNGLAPTLTTSPNQATLDGCRIRKLTPKECFRLQGWPDTYYEKAAEANSNSQLYKQAGNGVTVNVIYEIAKKLGGNNA